MSNKLKQLFDYQGFAKNDHLQRLIDDTMSRVNTTQRVMLSDDELGLVSAAGDLSATLKDKKDDV